MLKIFLLSILISCNETNSVKVKLNDPEDLDDDINMDALINKEKSGSMIKKIKFGEVDGHAVFLYTLSNTRGIKVKIINYGALITSITMPDKTGKDGDIVLGFDSLEPYLSNKPYFGAIVGRYANRIAHGRFRLEGKNYQLAINNGKNSLHGGIKGFDKVVWNSREVIDDNGSMLELTYVSKSGEEGYPGNLKVRVAYTLNVYNELITLIEAETDQATPVNLCNHTYFNLSEADTNILGHFLTLNADLFTEVNSELIPTGKLAGVRGTPMDFNNSVKIGDGISRVKGGYDHNYVLNKKEGELSLAAQLYDPRSGRQVEVFTTQPGIQFYSGNFLDGSIRGKGGKLYHQHDGLCLETQHYPDSPNQPSFPSTILKPGEYYIQKTVYRFSVLK